MSAGTLAPYAFPQFFDDNGDPLDGGLLYTYLSGLSTPAVTYQDADFVVQNTNPIVLSAGGRCKIYLDAISYKFILKSAAGVTLDTTDPVGSIGLTQSGTYEVFAFFGDPTSPISSLTYPSGNGFDKCHAGTAIFSIDSATLAPGTYKLQGMILSTTGPGAPVFAALVNLSDGAPDTPIVEMSGVSAVGNVVTSGAITFAAGGVVKNYGIKTKVSISTGFVWALQLIKTA